MKTEATDTATTAPTTRREILEWAEWFEANSDPEDRLFIFRQIVRVANGLPVERETA